MGSIKQSPFFIFGYVPLMKSTGQKITIKSWAEEDRPREKLAIKGKSFLSDVELIAILIGSGNKKESAVELSKRILFTYDNNLNQLGKLSIQELAKFKGIGKAKASALIFLPIITHLAI